MLIIAIYLIFSMLCVMWFDGTRYIIPNWLVGSLLALYPVAVWIGHGHADWKMALAAMGIVFAVGYVLFARNWMGGGDIKLLTVCSLWVEMQNLVDFIFLVSLLGGVLACALWGIRKFEPYLPRKNKELPRMFRNGEPVPYGLAIATAFLILFYMGRIPALF